MLLAGLFGERAKALFLLRSPCGFQLAHADPSVNPPQQNRQLRRLHPIIITVVYLVDFQVANFSKVHADFGNKLQKALDKQVRQTSINCK